MNEPTIESATTQPADAAAETGEGAVDNGAVKSDTQSKGAGTSQDLDIDRLDSHSAPEHDNGQPLETHNIATDGRLHAATLWLPCLEMFLGIIVPVLITSIFVPFGTVIFFVVCFCLFPAAALNVLRYITFR